MLLDIFKTVISPITGLIDSLHTSQEEKDKAKLALIEAEAAFQIKAMEYEAKIAEQQASVIRAEAQGQSWLQRNWRPLLMLSLTVILINNYIFVPYLSTAFPDKIKVLEFPAGFWGLLTLGVGGYIAGRTVEKVRGVS